MTEERRKAIHGQLLRTGTAQVVRLAAELGVSEVTIRRDLAEMEREGKLMRYHGGAVLPQALVPDVSFQEKESVFQEEKERIAQAAAALVKDGDTLALGAGTTVATVARALAGRKNLTVVTNAVNIAWEMSHRPEVRLVVTGGLLRESSYALVGPTAEHALRDFFVDVAFVGANGLSPEHGFTTPNQDEAVIHRALVSRARRAVIVIDHSKWGRIAFAQIGHLHQVHTVISDDKAPPDMVEELRRRGLEVIVV